MWFKTIAIPSGTKDIAAVKTWEVRWDSRYGIFSDNTNPEIEVFVSEEKAREFYDALVSAFKLLKYTCNKTTKVTMKERK